ncbi:hypothetical protein SBA4_860019 [Candidatus Sulfopaludibacter sp. SbA4]|nr:hypothetical protein SBA4_860019 [Candidatus Sulfopaludibacter sp. SbA4]
MSSQDAEFDRFVEEEAAKLRAQQPKNGNTWDGFRYQRPTDAANESDAPPPPPPEPEAYESPESLTPGAPTTGSVKDLKTIDGLAIFKAEHEVLPLVIENLLFNGVTLFGGRPKVGKSWLTLIIALAVAMDHALWGKLAIKRSGRVLYCALEEPPSRTTARMKKLIPQPIAQLGNIEFVYRLTALLAGGAAELDRYLTRNPASLVIIDTLSAVVQASGKRDVFRSDYNEVAILRQLAERHKTAILVVTHLRKMAAESVVDAIAGTTGLTAACDAIWGLRRQSNGDVLLEVTGREMEEKTYALHFETDPATFGWNFIGEGEDLKLSSERKEILDLLREDGPMEPKQIATQLAKNPNTTRVLLRKMAVDGDVVKIDKKYRVVGKQ